MQLNLLLYDTAAEEITSGQSNLTRGCIAAADGRFIRIRQNGRAHWRNLANTIELVLPSATPIHPKWQIDRLSHDRVSSGMPGNVLYPNNCPLQWGSEPTQVNNANGSVVFEQFTSEFRRTYRGMTFLSKSLFRIWVPWIHPTQHPKMTSRSVQPFLGDRLYK